jgi:hypothetical protein
MNFALLTSSAALTAGEVDENDGKELDEGRALKMTGATSRFGVARTPWSTYKK